MVADVRLLEHMNMRRIVQKNVCMKFIFSSPAKTSDTKLVARVISCVSPCKNT